ncbi:MAG: peptide deformylase [Saezia sp.]
MKLQLLYYPDKRLYTKAIPVEKIDETIVRLVDGMLETMYEANGVGLAATQVDVHQRVIVIDVSETRNQPLVLINPQLVGHSDERVCHQEGCLSVPEIYDEVQRWERVIVEALDKEGVLRQIEADGLLGRCIQHEMDHLEGNVFVDYLSPLKRNRIRTKMQKRARDEKKQ